MTAITERRAACAHPSCVRDQRAAIVVTRIVFGADAAFDGKHLPGAATDAVRAEEADEKGLAGSSVRPVIPDEPAERLPAVRWMVIRPEVGPGH